MATDEQWMHYTGGTFNGKQSDNARHAQSCRDTPLDADSILDLVWENVGYFGDHYYEPLTRPVEMRVEEYLASRGSHTAID